MPRRDWSRDELIVAFNLYCKIPFGQIHIRNPLIVELAKVIGRTPSAVSWKLANFARRDLHRRSIGEFLSEVVRESQRGWRAFDPRDRLSGRLR